LISTIFAQVLLLVMAQGTINQVADYELNATPETVVWGFYSATAKPAIRMSSGETIKVHTVSDTIRGSRALIPQPIQSSLDAIARNVTRPTDLGPHILTGPSFINEAEPGDMLEVQVLSAELPFPYATNLLAGGIIAEDCPNLTAMPVATRRKAIPLDLQNKVARFSDTIHIPIKPFFGSIGVAPPESAGRVSSGPPGIHGGNCDNKDLVAGTKLFLPVHVKGALLFIGDGHAGQGDGEVDGTALETDLDGVFRVIIHKSQKLEWPRAETPTHYVLMGLDRDLTAALKLATIATVNFLVEEKKLTREEAYMLASTAVDFKLTQAVDGVKGIHAMVPKSIFK
jgi:acetamidase/formamidase